MNNLLITIIECIYIIYMLNFFKTIYNIAHPTTYFNNKLFYHPVNIKSYPRSMICKFGNYMSIIISISLIIRCCFTENYKIKYMKYHKYILFTGLLLSLINFNALLYMLPIFIYELFLK